MKEIITIKGERYSYDEDTERIFKNGKLLSSVVAEPLFQGVTEDNIPNFVGIYLKDMDSVLSLSGNINPVTDINSI